MTLNASKWNSAIGRLIESWCFRSMYPDNGVLLSCTLLFQHSCFSLEVRCKLSQNFGPPLFSWGKKGEVTIATNHWKTEIFLASSLCLAGFRRKRSIFTHWQEVLTLACYCFSSACYWACPSTSPAYSCNFCFLWKVHYACYFSAGETFPASGG